MFQMNNLAFVSRCLFSYDQHTCTCDRHDTKKPLKRICPCNMTIKIHWFIPRFAILHIACNVKTQYDHRVSNARFENHKNTMNRYPACRHEMKYLHENKWWPDITSYGLDVWFLAMFELTWTWPNLTFGQLFMWIGANNDQIWLYGLDEWFWAMFEPTWTWPNFMWIGANNDQIWLPLDQTSDSGWTNSTLYVKWDK